MTSPIAVAGRRVLVRRPGPRVAELVQRLSEAGAHVVVDLADAGSMGATLRDLAGRELLELADGVGIDDVDVVVRDEPTRDGGPDERGGQVSQGGRVGRVVLVGGGPGDPGLLTVRGLEAVRTADVIVTDRLAPLSVLDQARPDAEVIHVGKIPRGEFTPQERINAVLVEHALTGRTVVRLKGGDNFVFGRGGEEWLACAEHGIPVEVVPGVSSSIAVPGLAGIPLTHRSLTQGFVVVSGHVPPGDPRGSVDWAALARLDLTLVILMGVATLPAVTAHLVEHGMDPATPAACVVDGAMPTQRSLRAPVAQLAAAVEQAGLTPPAVVVIGAVADALPVPPESPASTASSARLPRPHTVEP